MKSFTPNAQLLLHALSAVVVGLIIPSCAETGTRVTSSGATITTGGMIPDLIRARNERDRGPLPESTWNRLRMWKKVQTKPAIYIPVEYSKNSPRTDYAGQWFTDHRDGKRLFVPFAIEGDISASILAVEAAKIVDWQYSKGKSWYSSVDHRQ